jgi:hypothetical protein
MQTAMFAAQPMFHFIIITIIIHSIKLGVEFVYILLVPVDLVIRLMSVNASPAHSHIFIVYCMLYCSLAAWISVFPQHCMYFLLLYSDLSFSIFSQN